MRFPRFSSLPRLPVPAGRCVGIEFTGGELRAAHARSAGRRSELLDFAALGVADTGDGLPGIPVLREIRRRLDVKAGTKAVFVSPLARPVMLNMNRERVRKMRRHVLSEAVKWEAEIYSGIPGYQALAGAEVESTRVEPGQILEEREEVTVQVSVIEKNVYQAVKERFRLAGFRLVRVYSPEACFHVPLLETGQPPECGVLEIGAVSSGFMLIRRGEAVLTDTLNITIETIRDHLSGRPVPTLEDTLRANLNQAPPQIPVIVTGAGAADREVLRFVQDLSPHGAEPLVLRRKAGLTASGEGESAAMAVAAGAAFRELGKKKLRLIGISDSVPAGLRIRRSIYLMPVAAASLVFVTLLGHNLMMRHQENSLVQQRELIEAQLNERRKEQEEVKRLKNEIQSVESRIETIRRQIDYLSQEWDRPLREKIHVYESLQRLIPESVALSGIRQDGGESNRFVVSGVATGVADVLEFVVRLRHGNAARTVDVKRLERQPSARDRGVSHRFVIHMEEALQ